MDDMRTAEQWRAAGLDRHIIFNEMPYLSQWNCEPDILHVMCLGTDTSGCGTALWMLCYCMLPDTAANNCLQVWHDILQAYPTGSTSQFTSLTLSQFCDPSEELGGVIGVTGNYPSLKGKAGKVKQIIRPLQQVFVRYARNMQVDENQHGRGPEDHRGDARGTRFGGGCVRAT